MTLQGGGLAASLRGVEKEVEGNQVGNKKGGDFCCFAVDVAAGCADQIKIE
jgi:hypothetical protein